LDLHYLAKKLKGVINDARTGLDWHRISDLFNSRFNKA
jgi:hypothetical protein